MIESKTIRIGKQGIYLRADWFQRLGRWFTFTSNLISRMLKKNTIGTEVRTFRPQTPQKLTTGEEKVWSQLFGLRTQGRKTRPLWTVKKFSFSPQWLHVREKSSSVGILALFESISQPHHPQTPVAKKKNIGGLCGANSLLRWFGWKRSEASSRSSFIFDLIRQKQN